MEDAENGIFCPTVTVTSHGAAEQARLDYDFFDSPDYEAIRRVASEIRGLLEEGAYVQRGERRQPVSSFPQALDWMLDEARRGVDMQHYKGLGEMDPEQLWETTMDPEVRRMVVVTVDDAIAADQMFNTLMGDQVEPRREFIEANALSVVNLDI